MAASLPYPDKPKNGDAPDATPLLANFLALLQAINSFDASQISPGTITDSAFADAVNPRLRDGAWMSNWIELGGYTASFTGFTWVMPSGFAWYNGIRSPFTGQSYSVSASQDTYYYVSQTGVISSQGFANGATAPALPVSSQALVKVVSGASGITSIVDLRNLTPVSTAKILQTFSPVIGGATGCSGISNTMYYLNLGGVKLAWSTVAITSTATSGHVLNITLPPNFFKRIDIYVPSIMQVGNVPDQRVSGDGIALTNGLPASYSFYISNTSATSTATVTNFFVGA